MLGSKIEMISFQEGIDRLTADFTANGIPIDKPGFYDHPQFIAIEKSFPIYLNNYARFVQQRSYDGFYLDRARREIPIIANALHRELLSDGRQGACVDASAALSRILEKEGYWNFVVKGSLTITFASTSRIPNRYFWSVDQGDFVAGHAWVFAPPFKVLDITIRQQGHTRHEREYLPDSVLAESPSRSKPAVADIISPTLRSHLRGAGVLEKNQLKYVNPRMSLFLDTFDTYLINV